MSHSPQVPVPYAIVDPQDPEDLDLLAEADAWAVLAPDLTDPHIAALLQGVRDLSLDPGVVEPEPEVNPAASESSCSESESVSGGSAETDIRWYAVWQVPNQPEGGLPVIGIHTSVGPLAYRRILEANRNEFSLVAFVPKELIAELLLRPCLDLRLLSIRWTQSLPSASFDGRDGWSTGFYQAGSFQAALATSSGPVRKG